MKLNIEKVRSFLVESALPHGYQVSYKGRTRGGRFFLIIEKTGEGYSTSRVFIGMWKTISEVEVTKITRHSDGGDCGIGTTIVETSKGTFCFPTRFHTGRYMHSTLNGSPLTMFVIHGLTLG